MVSFRDRQRVNQRATTALLFAMVACVFLAVTPLWLLMSNPSIVFVLAVCAVAIVIPLFSYWFSDRLVLGATGAQIVSYHDCPEIFDIVDGLRIAAGLPMPRIAIINDPVPNALATGRNPENAVVAFTTGLLDSMDRREFEGVAAHELGHVANRDILLMSIAASVAAVLWGMLAFLGALGTHRDKDGNEEDGRPIAMFLMAFTPLIVTLINAGLSRRRESLADATAVQFTRDPSGLRSALEKLLTFEQGEPVESPATAHIWFNGRTSWRGRLFATHPPLEDRIARMREMEGVG